MSSFLARLVSYPRNRYVADGHNLDVARVTEQIWVMSLPSTSWPERLYRNNLTSVRAFLEEKFGSRYRVFELRAEGAGYEDGAFDGRVEHFPFVDHQPPPFALLPRILEALHAHLQLDGSVAVVHCKAGKGRSGLVTCSYLVAHEGWAEEEARRHFTEVRMRPGFGDGLSIPSQRRWLRYLAHWATIGDRLYRPERVKIERIQVRGLRSGCRLSLLRFEEAGAKIVTAHEFHADEIRVEGDVTTLTPRDLVMEDDVCIWLAQGKAYAHFWLNTCMEAQMQQGRRSFSIAWEEVDGWKGTKWRGSKAYDAVTLSWSRLHESPS